jgi:hypothetical protein
MVCFLLPYFLIAFVFVPKGGTSSPHHHHPRSSLVFLSISLLLMLILQQLAKQTKKEPFPLVCEEGQNSEVYITA